MDDLKQILIEQLNETWPREDFFVEHCDDSAPKAAGQWTAKDQLAHMSAWRNFCAEVLEATHVGAADPPLRNSDELNEVIYAENRDIAASVVREQALQSRQRLVDAVAACTVEELRRPRGTAARSYERWLNVPGNGHQHVAEHLIYWADESGDFQAAEEAALWCHQLDARLEVFDAFRGYSDFGLAVFYATRGKKDRALEFLRSAINANGALRDNASGEESLKELLTQI